jgi:hypothetical protein
MTYNVKKGDKYKLIRPNTEHIDTVEVLESVNTDEIADMVRCKYLSGMFNGETEEFFIYRFFRDNRYLYEKHFIPAFEEKEML